MTMQEIENSFGSNICRCTGYRPILDTFKSFANDASVTAKRQIVDIEDLYKLKACARAKSFGENNFGEFKFINKTDEAPRALHLELKNATFHKVLSINDLFSVFQHEPESYVLNGGNTAHGVYRLEKRKVYIDINDIPDLSHIVKDDASLTVGGNVTLTNAMRAFNKFSKEQGFEYLEQLAKHIDLIASVPIRNIGTIAGNLMIKHQNRDFPSDLFLILQTAGTKIHILESPSSKLIMTLLEFLDINMQYKVIYSLELPSLEESSYLRTFKIMPRSQNAHAIINAGFLFKMDNQRNVLDKPNIIFGGISPDLLHATKTEQFLIGKTLTNKSVISEALKILGSELNPDHVLPDKNPEYRRLLSQGLFYKFVLGIVTDTIDPKLKSGSTLLERSLSSGRQDFDTDRNIWPINKPIKKLEAMNQTSGEAEYVNDIPIQQNEVFCAFVLAEAPSEFTKIDISEAMTVDGFVAFFSASDIPGRNTFICPDHKLPFLDENEEVFADKIVTYAGQPVGLTVAKSHLAAMEAAKKVKILYADGPRRKAILSIDQALASNEKTRISKAANFPAQKPPGKNVQHVIRGNFNNGSQYHFSMETQCCVCVPLEDGMDIYSSTQWMDLIQASTSAVLNIPMNSINVIVRRVGGSYGGKVSRSAQLACACALAAHKLNVPARLVLSIEDNMKAMGKRYGMKQEYEVGVDEKGVIQYMNSEIWANSGSSFNDTHGPLTLTHLYNCYDGSNWNSVAYDVKTDIPSNTWCRAPGSCEAVGMVENIMEHIAKVTGNNPIEVRLANMDENDKVALEPMIEELKQLSDFDATEKSFKSFNNENRWKKRGISIVIMKYPMFTFFNFHVLVSIYARDGSVTVVHGGIEMGQGINTKVAQAVAFTLGIELDMVSVKPSITLTSANDCGSGGSITSEPCVYVSKTYPPFIAGIHL